AANRQTSSFNSLFCLDRTTSIADLHGYFFCFQTLENKQRDEVRHDKAKTSRFDFGELFFCYRCRRSDSSFCDSESKPGEKIYSGRSEQSHRPRIEYQW